MKKLIAWALILAAVISLAGCARTMDDVIQNEPHFTGIVVEQQENRILVDVNQTEEINSQYDIVSVSLDVEMSDSMTNFDIGDEVTVYYDGEITDPVKETVDTVYAITLITPANRG